MTPVPVVKTLDIIIMWAGPAGVARQMSEKVLAFAGSCAPCPRSIQLYVMPAAAERRARSVARWSCSIISRRYTIRAPQLSVHNGQDRPGTERAIKERARERAKGELQLHPPSGVGCLKIQEWRGGRDMGGCWLEVDTLMQGEICTGMELQ